MFWWMSAVLKSISAIVSASFGTNIIAKISKKKPSRSFRISISKEPNIMTKMKHKQQQLMIESKKVVLKERKDDVDHLSVIVIGEAVIVVPIINEGDITIDAIITETIVEIIEADIDTVDHLHNLETVIVTVIEKNQAKAVGMEAIKNIDVTGLGQDPLHFQDKEMIAITTTIEIVSTKEVVIHKPSTVTIA